MSIAASWNWSCPLNWSCPFCGTTGVQHALDCQRNSEQNRKLRAAIGQCLPGGYAIDDLPIERVQTEAER